jgi:hypothetical protein
MKSKALLVLLGSASAACDSTVNLDYQPRYFDELLASGICRAPDSVDDSQLDLSLQILSYTREGTVSLLPNDAVVIDGIPRQVEEELRSDDFEFALAANCKTDEVDPATFNSCAERSDQPSSQTGLSLLGSSLRYEVPGGDARRGDDRLVVLLLDNSGSLKGQPDPTQSVDPSKASDQRDERLTFFKNLVRLPYIPLDTYFSLVWFDQRQPHITQEFATPTRNRDVMVCPAGSDGATCRLDKAFDGLSQLERGEIGSTPLADALDQTYNIVINGKDTKAFNPVVILFTDGTERGDSSGSGKTLAQVTQTYANHTYGGQASPVPVIVLHLQPRLASGFAQGRDPELYALACATGGEYVFIERSDEFTTSNTLEPLVANRIAGAWKLRVSSTDTVGLGSGQYLLSSELSLTLGGKKESTALTSSDDETEDTRLWFVK